MATIRSETPSKNYSTKIFLKKYSFSQSAFFSIFLRSNRSQNSFGKNRNEKKLKRKLGAIFFDRKQLVKLDSAAAAAAKERMRVRECVCVCGRLG